MIGFLFYILGTFVAASITIWELNKQLKQTNDVDISPFAPMILLSWFTVGLYVYRYIKQIKFK